MKSAKILNRVIGEKESPFIIAEMSGNHNRSLERALGIVDAAAKSGAHALKLQTYTADTMTLNIDQEEFRINDPQSLWNGKTLYELYQEAHTPWEWHKPIFDLCQKLGLIGFSTPFDATAVDFLESLNVPCYKIASFENTDIPLIRKVASTGKPVFISTGMAKLPELKEIVEIFKKAKNKDLILLKCTSAYPASVENSNLLTIPDLKKKFGYQVGLSDHTIGIGAAIASVLLGATAIEKHFTLSRKDGGVDAAFSLEPNEMAQLVAETEKAKKSLGKISYGCGSDKEKKSLQFRRSIYVVEDIKEGELFTEKNIRSIRPGFGLPPKYLARLRGKKAKTDLKRGTPMSLKLVG